MSKWLAMVDRKVEVVVLHLEAFALVTVDKGYHQAVLDSTVINVVVVADEACVVDEVVAVEGEAVVGVAAAAVAAADVDVDAAAVAVGYAVAGLS